MSAPVSQPLVRPAAGGLGGAVLAHGVRLVRRGAVIVLVVAAGMSALVVQQHRTLFVDAVDAAAFQALAENPAIRILFGRPVGLEDPGGFTVWRTGTPLAVVITVWAMLAVVRITRGDEEAGRWEILAAGRFRLSRLVGLHLVVVSVGTLLVGLAVTAAMMIAGADPTGAVLYGAVLAGIGVGAAAWGALAAQLTGDRRRAATLAAAGIGAGLLARMIADGVAAFGWLHWVTPFGLLALTEPFTADRTAPLAVLAAAAAGFAVLAVVAARRRDLHDGLVVSRASYPARTVLLRSLPRFAARRSLGPVTAWGIGICLYFLVVGLLASSLTVFLRENPVFAELAAQAGFGSLTTVSGYLASLFALMAIPLGLFAASRISAAGADEEARRLTMLFSAPVTRRRWYVVEAAAALAGTVLLAVAAGLAAYTGAAAVGADISAGAAVAGAVNVLPVAWLSLGAALLAFGWWPTAILPVGAIPAAGGFLLQVLAESLDWPDWVARLSPYAHLNAVPFEGVDWVGAAGMALVAVLLVGVGLVGFARRDMQG